MDDPKLRAYPGTDRLGRPLTDDEKKDLGLLLRAHDFVGASLVALAFAFKLTKTQAGAQDLRGRSNLRLVRQGWDPRVVTLVKCLCRYTWSEWTHQTKETATARKAEEAFLLEREIEAGSRDRFGKPIAPAGTSTEDRAVEVQESFDRQAHATAQIESLRLLFEQAGDQVNLLWLEYSLQEITSIAEMSRLSGRPAEAFYDAADRRKRHVKKLVQAMHLEKS